MLADSEKSNTSIKDWQNKIIHSDNLAILKQIPSNSVELIYIDPPFNTGKEQSRCRIKTVATNKEAGDRTGFGGKRYATNVVHKSGYADTFSDFMGFLEPRLHEAHRILTANGSLFFHIDWRESANCRLLLEKIFGGSRHCMNEIIWAYDYGGRSQSKWPAKHDNIYWFAKNPDDNLFNYDAMDRIPYMASELVGKEKAERGKTPTDVWWHTIVATNGKEKTGYSTQKPIDLLRWIIAVHSNVGDTVLDFFAGSGTSGEAAKQLKRNFILIDKNAEAISIMNKRVNAKYEKSNIGHKIELIAIEKKLQSKIVDLKNQSSYRPDRKNWLGSPNAWIKDLAPAAKGKFGKELMCYIFNNFLNKEISKSSGRVIKIQNTSFMPKFSMQWESGMYKFEQIKKGDDYFCFLGISPFKYHFWIIPSEEYDNFNKQHNENSRWFEINPDNPGNVGSTPLSKYGGDLSQLAPAHFDYIKLSGTN